MAITELKPIIPTQPNWSKTEKMKAVVYHNKKVAVDDHAKPELADPRDAIVKVTAATVCGSDLHLSKGNVINTPKGEILGHEGVGLITEIGSQVKNFKVGDRVCVSAVIACGDCDFCKMNKFSNCNSTNDSVMMDNMLGSAPSALFGYSGLTGNYPGLQAQYTRVPLCDTNLLHLPAEAEVTDDEAVLLSDVLPTAYQGVLFSDFGIDEHHKSLVVIGSGPIGIMAAYLARKLFNGKDIIIIDPNEDRLEIAKSLNCNIKTIKGIAKMTNISVEDEVISMLGGRRPDCVIDATGFDYTTSLLDKVEQKLMMKQDATESLNFCIHLVRKSGTVSVSGVYTGFGTVNLGAVMNKALIIKSGQLHVQAYWQSLLKDILSKKIDVKWMVTTVLPLTQAAKGYADFENKKENVLKVCLKPWS